MEIIYNWEINIPLLLTILLTITHGLITIFLKIRRFRLDKMLILEPIYPKAKYLIGLPLKQKDNLSYTHEDKIIEKIVKRKFSDFINDVDIYWSYYGKPEYPELEHFDDQEKQKYISIIEKEFEWFFSEKYLNHKLPLSPACSYDDPETKRILNEIILFLQEKRSSFPKPIRVTIKDIESNPPETVFKKYQAQLKHDPEYFLHNNASFSDPYRKITFQIRELYEKYSMNIFQRKIFWIKEHFWEIPYKLKIKRN